MKTLEKIFSVFLALQLCFTALPIQAFAKTAEEANIEQSTEAPVLNEAEALKENSEADNPSTDKQPKDTESALTEAVIAESGGEVQRKEHDEPTESAEPRTSNLRMAEGELQTAGGDGSIENPYQIATAEQLDSLRYDTESHYYIQTQDIDLSGYDSWMPIGNGDSPFKGSYDGNGCVIDNMKIMIESCITVYPNSDPYPPTLHVYAGLFGNIYNAYGNNDNYLKNIEVMNCNITGAIPGKNDPEDYLLYHTAIGGIVGEGDQTRLINCHVSGAMVIDVGDTDSDNSIGGIAGQAKSAESCTNDVNISVDSDRITSIDPDSQWADVAGIIGLTRYSYASNKTIDCLNNGKISSKVAGNLAGISGDTRAPNQILGCTNNGALDGVNTNIGGIVASCTAYTNSEVGFISSCINKANITGKLGDLSRSPSVGGIVGYNVNHNVIDCKNACKKIEYPPEEKVYLGRIIGDANPLEFKNNMALNTMTINGKVPTEDIGPDKRNGQSATLAEMGLPDESLEITKIVFSSDYKAMRAGESSKILPSFEPEGAVDALNWTTSNTEIATVDASGLVKAAKAGTAMITATDETGQHSASMTIIVEGTSDDSAISGHQPGKTFTKNETIDGDQMLINNSSNPMRVSSGVSVTVRGDMKIGNNGALVIETGGRLYIEGGDLEVYDNGSVTVNGGELLVFRDISIRKNAIYKTVNSQKDKAVVKAGRDFKMESYKDSSKLEGDLYVGRNFTQKKGSWFDLFARKSNSNFTPSAAHRLILYKSEFSDGRQSIDFEKNTESYLSNLAVDSEILDRFKINKAINGNLEKMTLDKTYVLPLIKSSLNLTQSVYKSALIKLVNSTNQTLFNHNFTNKLTKQQRDDVINIAKIWMMSEPATAVSLNIQGVSYTNRTNTCAINIGGKKIYLKAQEGQYGVGKASFGMVSYEIDGEKGTLCTGANYDMPQFKKDIAVFAENEKRAIVKTLLGIETDEISFSSNIVDKMTDYFVKLYAGKKIEWIEHTKENQIKAVKKSTAQSYKTGDAFEKAAAFEAQHIEESLSKEETVIEGNKFSDKNVSFEDANLERAVKQVTGKTTLTVSDIEKIESLALDNKGIKSLKGLENAKNLRILQLSGNEVTDLSPISGLKELRVLDIRANLVGDLMAVQSLKNLVCLLASYTGCEDASSLAELTQLETLDVSSNYLKDLSFLAKLSKIKNLKISENAFNHSDISVLGELYNLEILQADNSGLTGSLKLDQSTRLNHMEISYNSLDHLELSECPLKILNIGNNQITDLTGITKAIDLEALNAENNQLSSIAGIERCPQLKILNIGGNFIKEINELMALTNMEYLNCSQQEIENYLPISAFKQLKSLNISETIPSNLDFIKNYTLLEELEIAECGLRNEMLGSIAELKNLKYLNVAGNSLDNLTIFANMVLLEDLNVKNNNIERLSGIEAIAKNLKSINISENPIQDTEENSKVINHLEGAGVIIDKEMLELEGLEINDRELLMKVGEKACLKMTTYPLEGTALTFKWTSDNENVATVDNNGNVLAVSEGSAEITVMDEKSQISDKCRITVSESEIQIVNIEKIELNIKEANLKTSEAVQLTATITPENATNKNVSWTSSDEKVATVKGGVVTAVGEGKATITVTTEDGNKTAECTVTVTKKEEPTPVEPTTPTVEPENNNPSGNNGTKTDTTVQTAAKNNSSNPSTSLTNQEKISTLLVMCTVTALCALAIFSIKRKQTK
ncbi:Ig-like domain-containing protein [Eubacterium maltosivorans]|uniref:BIG2 domain-containing protein n=1 Tax=Eubacterium maltosivorans TaxID=2041044 RepID=A0A4P9CDK1_EUBML|nr:Ig-like domain-containing protein [Eubacterium maltosivorans]QCT72961.1 hypothetical protein CPZ25_017050 [Eubacterium maltosivorans]